VLIKNSGLVDSARRWNLRYLKKNASATEQNTVFVSETKR
jgi:hypothetical protein